MRGRPASSMALFIAVVVVVVAIAVGISAHLLQGQILTNRAQGADNHQLLCELAKNRHLPARGC